MFISQTRPKKIILYVCVDQLHWVSQKRCKRKRRKHLKRKKSKALEKKDEFASRLSAKPHWSLSTPAANNTEEKRCKGKFDFYWPSAETNAGCTFEIRGGTWWQTVTSSIRSVLMTLHRLRATFTQHRSPFQRFIDHHEWIQGGQWTSVLPSDEFLFQFAFGQKQMSGVICQRWQTFQLLEVKGSKSSSCDVWRNKGACDTEDQQLNKGTIDARPPEQITTSRLHRVCVLFFF